MPDYTIIPLANEHCATGENPYWNPDDECVYWTDIPNGKLFRYDARQQAHECIYQGDPVGGFTLQVDGNLLLFRVKDLAILNPQTLAVEILREFTDEGMARFNDVSADPEGRVFAGTMSGDLRGGLYRFDPDGSVTKLFVGTNVSNGMGWTADLKTMFWTDSTAKTIYRFDYDRDSGAISNRSVFYQADAEEGVPDGMVVDAQGNVWSARWDGFCLTKHASDGRVVDRIKFPVGKVSSACFGGPKSDRFFVTTAGGEQGSQTEDGTIYELRLPVAGQPEFRSRIGLD